MTRSSRVQVRSQLRDSLRVLKRLRVHPLFIVLVLVAVGVGLWRDVVFLFILILLHELGHALTANALGYEVEEVSLLPFGGVAKLSYGNLGFDPRHEAAIAIAGPLVNLLLSLLAWGLQSVHLWSTETFTTVLQLNLWIAVFNLLPGLPLDGGRVLRAARSRRIGYQAATEEGYRVSIVISFALLLLGAASLWVGSPHVGAIILGVFLFVAAWSGRRGVPMDTIRFLDAKNRRSKHKPQPVHALAVRGQAQVKDVVQAFAPDRYHMIYVLDESDTVQTLIEEQDILDAVFEGRWLERLDSWVNRP